MVDLAQAQEREEFLRMKYCALLKEKGTIVWTRVMNSVFMCMSWICVFVYMCVMLCVSMHNLIRPAGQTKKFETSEVSEGSAVTLVSFGETMVVMDMCVCVHMCVHMLCVNLDLLTLTIQVLSIILETVPD